MTQPPLLRPAQSGDYPRLLHIWRAAVEASHLFLTPRDVDWYEDLVREYLPRMATLEVAELSDGTVAGFVAHDNGHVHMLFVDPALQGHGMGSALLATVADRSAVLSVDVNEQNPSAVNFYAARGFRRIGRSEIDGQGRPFPLLHLRRP